MKKLLVTMALVVTFFTLTAASAGAVVNDTVKVGLRFGSSALFSANLQNEVGSGYEFGWFDEDRDFVTVGWTEEEKLSMTAAGTIYMPGDGTYSSEDGESEIGSWHVQLDEVYDDYDEALEVAQDYDGYVAYIDEEYVVRVGSYTSKKKARSAAEDLDVGGSAVESGGLGVIVTVTGTDQIIFEFECEDLSLGVMPQGSKKKPAETWFKGYKYKGGFEYVRPAEDPLLRVINVVDIEDYVKGVVPYEMGGDWPMAAMEAQAVCARTVAARTTKHLSLYGFDVCATTDCQVYNGTNRATDDSDEAVDNTEGECMYYDGELIEAVYHSSNGGATEDAEVVWGGRRDYLVGKVDPYEELIDIPNYEWSVTYTAEQLTWILAEKGFGVGNIVDVYISEYSDMANVAAVTFVDDDGYKLTFHGDNARTIFYSSTFEKSVRSLRYVIEGGSGSSERPAISNGSSDGKNSAVYVNSKSNKLTALEGLVAIASGGKDELEGDSFYAITADGKEEIELGSASVRRSTATSAAKRVSGSFTIVGVGNGHNVGMSQYGARAMAEDGYDYDEILEFYYTDIDIRLLRD